MSILIEGMKMPTNGCQDCKFVNHKWHGDICPFLKREVTGNVERGGSQTDCPLIPVPQHGRLIDADALVEDLKHQCEEVFKIDAVSPDDFWITRDHAYNERLWKTWCESFFEYLKERDTFIPASEED